MRQTDGQKIYDGLLALTYRVVDSQENENDRQKSIKWCVIAVNKIEDWPPDHVLLADSGERFTMRGLIRHIFSGVAHDAYHSPISEELLLRLRPDEKHAEWLGEWEKSEADLESSRKDANNIAAGKPVKPMTTQRGSP